MAAGLTRGAALLQLAQQDAAQQSRSQLRRQRAVIAAPRYASRRRRTSVTVSAARGESARVRYDRDLGLGDSGDSVRSLQSTLHAPTTGVRTPPQRRASFHGNPSRFPLCSRIKIRCSADTRSAHHPHAQRFDLDTVQALKRWQSDHGLPASGFLGALSREVGRFPPIRQRSWPLNDAVPPPNAPASELCRAD